MASCSILQHSQSSGNTLPWWGLFFWTLLFRVPTNQENWELSGNLVSLEESGEMSRNLCRYQHRSGKWSFFSSERQQNTSVERHTCKLPSLPTTTNFLSPSKPREGMRTNPSWSMLNTTSPLQNSRLLLSKFKIGSKSSRIGPLLLCNTLHNEHRSAKYDFFQVKPS